MIDVFDVPSGGMADPAHVRFIPSFVFVCISLFRSLVFFIWMRTDWFFADKLLILIYYSIRLYAAHSYYHEVSLLFLLAYETILTAVTFVRGSLQPLLIGVRYFLSAHLLRISFARCINKGKSIALDAAKTSACLPNGRAERKGGGEREKEREYKRFQAWLRAAEYCIGI